MTPIIERILIMTPAGNVGLATWWAARLPRFISLPTVLKPFDSWVDWDLGVR